jgi:predicted ATP-binding protein involved in virulence
MKLKNIEISNFRCFKSYKIEFAKGVTVLIGKNGSGKTTLINAIKHGLSFIFSKDKKVNGGKKSIATSAYKLGILSFDRMDARYGFEEQEPVYPVSIQCEATVNENLLLSWELIKETANGGLYTTKYKEAYSKFKKEKQYPVLAVYSDSFPHIKSNKTKYVAEVLGSGRPVPQNFGYYQWGAETACTDVWERRFIDVWREIFNKHQAYSNYSQYVENKEKADAFLKQYFPTSPKEEQTILAEWNKSAEKFPQAKLMWEIYRLEKEKEIVSNYLKIFSEPISELTQLEGFKLTNVAVVTRDKEDYISFAFESGEDILFKNLPAGYRRLFSIVFDIAYRAFILQLRGNSNHFPISLKKPEDVSGIVVIDEIDLHLHPALQQEVIQRFQRTFPNIQFIVSTHAPLVMSNVEQDRNNQIYKLSHNQSEYTIEPVKLYGMDIASITEYALETTPRNIEIDLQLKNLFSLIDNEQYAEAKKEIARMRKIFGSNLPELAKAQTMLDFLEDDTDK